MTEPPRTTSNQYIEQLEKIIDDERNARIAELEGIAGDREKEIAALRVEVENQKILIDRRDGDIAMLETNRDAVIGQAEETIDLLREEVKALESRLTENISRYLETVPKARAELERMVYAKDKKIGELKRGVADLERVLAIRDRKIEELREALGRESEATQALDIDIEGRMNDVKSLTSTLLDRDRRITELERIVGVRENDLKMLRDEISRLEKVVKARAQETTDIRARALRLHKALQGAWWVEAAEDLQELREWAES
jgi:chromosome segregation ATPase